MNQRESKDSEKEDAGSVVPWRPPKETDGGEKEERMEINPRRDVEKAEIERLNECEVNSR